MLCTGVGRAQKGAVENGDRKLGAQNTEAVYSAKSAPGAPTPEGRASLQEVFTFDPRVDLRWNRFVDRREDASVFHTAGWLEALRRTYGYEPVVYTTSPPGAELSDGLIFCRIDTWLSGKRLVSLPFSDHSALLVDDEEVLHQMLLSVREQVTANRWRYVELRPVRQRVLDGSDFRKAATYYWHKLSLDRDLDQIYKGFHKSCVQRKIRRAEREGLTYSEGRSAAEIEQFYRLLLLTHRRHGIPPQPLSWFRNLVDSFGPNLKIRLASKNGRALASIVTLTYKQSMVYKYGCSDAAHHNLGGMIFLLWKAIQEAKGSKLRELDLGRSDCDNPGLISFKENLGAERGMLTYCGYPERARPDPSRWDMKAARKICTRLPAPALTTMGRLLYRHMG